MCSGLRFFLIVAPGLQSSSVCFVGQNTAVIFDEPEVLIHEECKWEMRHWHGLARLVSPAIDGRPEWTVFRQAFEVGQEIHPDWNQGHIRAIGLV